MSFNDNTMRVSRRRRRRNYLVNVVSSVRTGMFQLSLGISIQLFVNPVLLF